MHKSQLAGFIIDCETDDLDAAAGFWSAAPGLAPITERQVRMTDRCVHPA